MSVRKDADAEVQCMVSYNLYGISYTTQKLRLRIVIRKKISSSLLFFQAREYQWLLAHGIFPAINEMLAILQVSVKFDDLRLTNVLDNCTFQFDEPGMSSENAEAQLR